jgi:hypothetical protein
MLTRMFIGAKDAPVAKLAGEGFDPKAFLAKVVNWQNDLEIGEKSARLRARRRGGQGLLYSKGKSQAHCPIRAR